MDELQFKKLALNMEGWKCREEVGICGGEPPGLDSKRGVLEKTELEADEATI